MDRTLNYQAVIVGIGQTDFSKNSGRSELQLAAECVKAAIDDAGLSVDDIDGMSAFTLDTSDEIELARTLGIPKLTFWGRVPSEGVRQSESSTRPPWRCIAGRATTAWSFAPSTNAQRPALGSEFRTDRRRPPPWLSLIHI